MRTNEETHSLSPIEEEPELMLRIHESFGNFTINEPKNDGCEEHRRLPRRRTEECSSSEDERDRYRLKKVEGSYCCFRADAVSKEAEASGDNDEAETGLGDKSDPRTTVEQLRCGLSQVEREILALKRRQSPRRCQGHERCEQLWRGLMIWRDDYEKRIDSRLVRWQTTERKRIHEEMENARRLYGGVQRHLDTLVRRSASCRLDFRRQIDMWEKRLKRDVVDLHENNLMEFREQFRAWFEMQNATNLSSVGKKRNEVRDSSDETALGTQVDPEKSSKLEGTLCESDVEFLCRIENVIKFEVQQQRDDLARRMDRKIAELWSAFEEFKHNFHLDRDYRRHDRVEVNEDGAESSTTEDPSDLAR